MILAFDLKPEEEARLRAALLATAVEMLLMDRVDMQIALQAADEAFQALLSAIQLEPPPPGMSGVRDPAPLEAYSVAVEYPEPLARAIDAIDRATLALHLSEGQAPTTERVDRAAEAQMGYTRALAVLQQPPDAEVDREIWAYWRDEATRWKASASQRLLALLDTSKHDDA